MLKIKINPDKNIPDNLSTVLGGNWSKAKTRVGWVCDDGVRHLDRIEDPDHKLLDYMLYEAKRYQQVYFK